MYSKIYLLAACCFVVVYVSTAVYILEPTEYTVIMEPGDTLYPDANSPKYSKTNGFRFVLEPHRLAIYDMCNNQPVFTTFNDSTTQISRLSLDHASGHLQMSGGHGTRRDSVLWKSGASPAIRDYSTAELRISDNGFLELCASERERCYWQSAGFRYRTCENAYGTATNVVLRAGQSLRVDQIIESPNGQYKIQLNSDGNFVLTRKCDDRAVFSTYSYPGVAGNVTLERDGNLVVYGTVYIDSGRALWFAEPWKGYPDTAFGNSQLRMDNTGVLYLCQQGAEKCFWQSGFLLYFDHCDQVHSEHSGSRFGETVSGQSMARVSGGSVISSTLGLITFTLTLIFIKHNAKLGLYSESI